MLSHLKIRNLAIIDTIDIAFEDRMNVLTGETGAGKSIIIQAANLILGGRADSSLVRSGAKEAVIEALFDLDAQSHAINQLKQFGIDICDALIIRRTISAEGKNRIFINGSPVTLSMLNNISDGLINITSQHEGQFLFKAGKHLELLDFDAKLTPDLSEYRQAFLLYKKLGAQFESINSARQKQSDKKDLLTFQLDDISKHNLKPDEDIALNEEKKLLVNAERLALSAAFADKTIYTDENAIYEKLSGVLTKLKDAAHTDSKLSDTAAKLENMLYQLEDIAFFIRGYGEQILIDPARLEEIESRLADIDRLKKKYGPTIADILSYRDNIADELEKMDHSKSDREALEKKLGLAHEKAIRLSGALSEKRQQAALKLSKKVSAELNQLGLKGAVFDTRVTTLNSSMSETGVNEARFYISANPGEEPRPLSKVASGGELSRILLALKRVIHGSGETPCYIFDEVDAGIGGAIAEVVGIKLKEVSAKSQVICITHLPQIAALGDSHFRVSKKVCDERTFAVIERLNDSEKISEVARMLGGVDITDRTLEHAREMVEKHA